MADRRTFLQMAGTAALGSLCLGALGCAEREAPGQAAEPASEGDTARSLDAIGVQLYTVRTLMEGDPEGTLEQIAAIGYDTVETAGFYGKTPQEFRALLDEHGLRSPSGHYTLERFQDDLDGVLETAQNLGQSYLVCPYLAEEDRTSLDNYRALAEEFNEFGRRCQEAGLQFAYHNHDFEFETFGGEKPAYDLLLEQTDPELVQMELDLFWVTEAGHDPLSYLERYAGRFPLFHVKDRTQEGEMVSVGKGAIDFARILGGAQDGGQEIYAFVEHDNPEDPLASIRASHQHLEQLTL